MFESFLQSTHSISTLLEFPLTISCVPLGSIRFVVYEFWAFMFGVLHPTPQIPSVADIELILSVIFDEVDVIHRTNYVLGKGFLTKFSSPYGLKI